MVYRETKYDYSFLEFQLKNTPINHFVPKVIHIYSYIKLCIIQTQSVDFKNENVIVKFQLKNTQSQAFLTSNLKIFIFKPTFAIKIFESVQNTLKRYFWSQI